jgi:hypothetical protein
LKDDRKTSAITFFSRKNWWRYNYYGLLGSVSGDEELTTTEMVGENN